MVVDALDFGKDNVVTLVPLSSERRGVGMDLTISGGSYGDLVGPENLVVPKAPNTGKR